MMTSGCATPPATTTSAAHPVWARHPSAAALPLSREPAVTTYASKAALPCRRTTGAPSSIHSPSSRKRPSAARSLVLAEAEPIVDNAKLWTAPQLARQGEPPPLEGAAGFRTDKFRPLAFDVVTQE